MAAATLYAATSIATAVFFTLIWVYVLSRPGLLVAGLDPDRVRRRLPFFSMGPIVYLACLAIAQFSATLVVVLCGLVAVYYFWDWLPEPAGAARERDS